MKPGTTSTTPPAGATSPIQAAPDLELKAKQDAEAAEAKAKADAEAKTKALADAKAQVVAAAEALQGGLALAKKTLGHALRVMIANQFPENDGGRRIAENAFEDAKNVREGKATREDLAKAAKGLTDAVNHIANHSLKFPGDLDELRGGLRKVAAALEQHDAVNPPAA